MNLHGALCIVGQSSLARVSVKEFAGEWKTVMSLVCYGVVTSFWKATEMLYISCSYVVGKQQSEIKWSHKNFSFPS